MRIEEAAELLGLRVGGHGRRQSNAKSFGASALYSFPCPSHVPRPPMPVVEFRCGAIEADLQRDAITRERAKRFDPVPREQHTVREHCR